MTNERQNPELGPDVGVNKSCDISQCGSGNRFCVGSTAWKIQYTVSGFDQRGTGQQRIPSWPSFRPSSQTAERGRRSASGQNGWDAVMQNSAPTTFLAKVRAAICRKLAKLPLEIVADSRKLLEILPGHPAARFYAAWYRACSAESNGLKGLIITGNHWFKSRNIPSGKLVKCLSSS